MTRERLFDSVASILKAADEGLYKAKETGRNRCVRG
jgi:PleD family two-component response regulator